MYSHIQLDEQGRFSRFISAGELIVWDANNYCTAVALEKDGKAEQFRVHQYHVSGKPSYDQITQIVREIDPAPVDGLWTQQWEIVPLDADAIAANITRIRSEKRSAINAKRDALEATVFPYSGKLINSDSRSVQRINTAVQAAQVALAAGQPYEVDWTCADDSTLTLDAQGMLGMPVALAMHADALHRHARSLKAHVDAAQTAADLATIDVDAGWPV